MGEPVQHKNKTIAVSGGFDPVHAGHIKMIRHAAQFGDVIVIRSMMYITLGYDHRLIDGAYGTRFLSRVTALIEAFDGSGIKL